MANLDTLEIQIRSESDSAQKSLEQLATTLGTLRTACAGGCGLRATVNNLTRLSTATAGLDVTSLTNLSTALESIGKASATGTGLKAAVTALKSIPKVADTLSKMDMTKFADSIKSAATALDPLIEKLKEISGNRDAITALRQLSKMSGGGSGGSGGGSLFGGRMSGLFTLGAGAASLNHINGVIQSMARPLAECIEKANSYVEALNLFTVALGSYADKAQEYAELVSSKVGIDPADWLRAEGTFMTLVEGFGVMEDRAYVMSQNLTQLGYDLASFFNISVADAMQKVQSGISGELEPLVA